jgi:2-polyprenyl-6-methoxyphenol hydroxylase-like FAD-dependent oxidoreductase
LIDLAEETDGVMAVLVDRETGEETRVRARYVLAADGANSTVRRRLGIGVTGPARWDAAPPSCSTPTSRFRHGRILLAGDAALMYQVQHRRGISPQGALLVRPDGYVGARWPDSPPDDSTLEQTTQVACTKHSLVPAF